MMEQPTPGVDLSHLRVGRDERGSCCWEVVDGDVVVRAATLREAWRILIDRWEACDESSTGEGGG
jgi:hypothetical protein